ncbi:hypothetical protein [uncultured Thermomonospora sp.]|uniref:hypothetical protein n=1 Tax=uncultured Thermomonospora sp. TaxID=671175 RepID=UPI00259B19D1|nr:hypothetical protein [uncultured Thermomonospora sp.]
MPRHPEPASYSMPPEHAVPFWERPWVGLPDCPPCPLCNSPHTRWDSISPDYPGDWWECEHDHRFLLTDSGRTYPASEIHP